MAGGGPKKKIEWSAVGLAFQLLIVVVAGLMAYAYLNGSTGRALQDHERRIESLESERKQGAEE